MKKLMMMMAIMICSVGMSFGQDSTLTASKTGFNDFIVTSCEGKTQNEIFKKVKDFIAVTYKNPSKVILAEIENEYIRFEGVSQGLLVTKGLMTTHNDVKYQIEISVKDGKFKFDLLKEEYYITPSQYAVGGWMHINYKGMFNSKGVVRKPFAEGVIKLENHFNGLKSRLKDFIMETGLTAKKDNW